MKQYIIFDERGVVDTEDATVLGVCDTLKEAREAARDMGFPCCIYQCTVSGDSLEGGKLVSLIEPPKGGEK